MPTVIEEVRVQLLEHQGLFVLSDDVPVLCMDGAFGAAKTLGLCAWALRECERWTNNLLLIGRQEYRDLADSTIRSFFELHPDHQTAANWNESKAVYTHPNGSQILFRHLDDDEGIKNLNLGGVGIDQAEEVRPDRFDLLLGRLRRPNSSRQMRLTDNPNGHDWIWQLFYGRGSQLWTSPHVVDAPQESPDYRDGYRVIRCTMLDNPFLPADYVQSMLANPSREFVEQYVYGSREVMPGYRFFDAGKLRQQVIFPPIAVGYFVEGFPHPEWRDQAGGPIRLYEKYDTRDRFVLGLDIASGEGSSWSAGVCRNATINRVAAVIDANLDPDELAQQGWLLSRYFGNALIAPERNGLGFSCVLALQKLTANIFSERVQDSLGGGSQARLGWVTDAASRMELFAQLQREIRLTNLELRDAQLIEQCKAITMTNGKPKAETGFRDDLVLACGIAGMVRQLRPSIAVTTATALEPVLAGAGRPEARQFYGFGRTTKVAGR